MCGGVWIPDHDLNELIDDPNMMAGHYTQGNLSLLHLRLLAEKCQITFPPLVAAKDLHVIPQKLARILDFPTTAQIVQLQNDMEDLNRKNPWIIGPQCYYSIEAMARTRRQLFGIVQDHDKLQDHAELL